MYGKTWSPCKSEGGYARLRKIFIEKVVELIDIILLYF